VSGRLCRQSGLAVGALSRSVKPTSTPPWANCPRPSCTKWTPTCPSPWPVRAPRRRTGIVAETIPGRALT
jgi:hypothetical protein